MAGKNDGLTEKFGKLSTNQACEAGCCEIYENESTHTKQRLGDEPILGNLHEFCAAFYHTRGLSNTEASIPTVSLVILFLPSLSVGTDGEMNTRSVNVQNPFVNEVVSIIARA